MTLTFLIAGAGFVKDRLENAAHGDVAQADADGGLAGDVEQLEGPPVDVDVGAGDVAEVVDRVFEGDGREPDLAELFLKGGSAGDFGIRLVRLLTPETAKTGSITATLAEELCRSAVRRFC